MGRFPFILIVSIGFIVTAIDFIFLQNLKFQFVALIGLAFIILGGYLRIKARLELRKTAGFGNLVSTSRLQIVKGHQLVKKMDSINTFVIHYIYVKFQDTLAWLQFFEHIWNFIYHNGNNLSTISNKCRRKNAYRIIRFRL